MRQERSFKIARTHSTKINKNGSGKSIWHLWDFATRFCDLAHSKKIIRLIGKAKIYGKRIGLYVVLGAEMVMPAKLGSWRISKQENPLMAVVECMEVYQQVQRRRKAKRRAGKLHVVGCLLIGQEKESLFPNMRVRHGVHISKIVSIDAAEVA